MPHSATIATLLATLAAVTTASARADDAAAITVAVDTFYQGTIYTTIDWSHVVIDEDDPYAIFYARVRRAVAFVAPPVSKAVRRFAH